jgi:hypothetical protein
MCQNIQNMILTRWVDIEILGPHINPNNLMKTSQLHGREYNNITTLRQNHKLITYLKNNKYLKRILYTSLSHHMTPQTRCVHIRLDLFLGYTKNVKLYHVFIVIMSPKIRRAGLNFLFRLLDGKIYIFAFLGILRDFHIPLERSRNKISNHVNFSSI